jgi:hypothetical protein
MTGWYDVRPVLRSRQHQYRLHVEQWMPAQIDDVADELGQACQALLTAMLAMGPEDFAVLSDQLEFEESGREALPPPLDPQDVGSGVLAVQDVFAVRALCSPTCGSFFVRQGVWSPDGLRAGSSDLRS